MFNPDLSSPTIPHVLKFAEAMEGKLAKNRHKGDREGWLKNDPWELFNRLRVEVKELDLALTHCQSPDEVLKECADIANFAMMVADSYRHRKESTAKAQEATV